jgi:hypothetical protein
LGNLWCSKLYLFFSFFCRPVSDLAEVFHLQLAFRRTSDEGSASFSGHVSRLRRIPLPLRGLSRHPLSRHVFIFANLCFLRCFPNFSLFFGEVSRRASPLMSLYSSFFRPNRSLLALPPRCTRVAPTPAVCCTRATSSRPYADTPAAATIQ